MLQYHDNQISKTKGAYCIIMQTQLSTNLRKSQPCFQHERDRASNYTRVVVADAGQVCKIGETSRIQPPGMRVGMLLMCPWLRVGLHRSITRMVLAHMLRHALDAENMGKGQFCMHAF